MQVQGIGNEHNKQMHHVTTCIYDHSVAKKTGGAAMASQAGRIVSEAVDSRQPEGRFSLSAWLEKTMRSGKHILMQFWGEGGAASKEAGAAAEEAVLSAEHASSNAAGHDSSLTGQSVLSTVLHEPPARNNPYFSPVENPHTTTQSVREKMRIRLKGITKYFSKHPAGSFLGKDTFRAKQEKPKEDLHRRSKYKEEDRELECVLTDDSYLLDSYDRRGGYSRISTKK